LFRLIFIDLQNVGVISAAPCIIYWNMKEGPLARTSWRGGFRRGYGPAARQTKQRTDVFHTL